MLIIYIILWLPCSLALFLFGFFVGRCARKFPIIDNGLPWTLSRNQILHACQACEHVPGKPTWPSNPHY